MSIVNLIKQFLDENGIDVSYLSLIEDEDNKISKFFNINDNSIREFQYKFIYNILTETYKLNSENVKSAAQDLEKIGISIGRYLKDLLLDYYNYKDDLFLQRFLDSLKKQNESFYIDTVVDIIKYHCEDKIEQARQEFLRNWRVAEEKGDLKKLKDYLLGIHSRILYWLNPEVSLKDIFIYNEKFIKKELTKNSFNMLKEFCYNNSLTDNISKIAKIFNDKYMEILKRELQEQAKKKELNVLLNQYYFDKEIHNKEFVLDRGTDLELFPTEEYDLIHLNINQRLFDEFNDQNSFYDYIFYVVEQAYRILDNNKVFTIKIENINANGKNIKWDLYSKLGIFCENFIETIEENNFYKPEIICADMLSKYNIKLIDDSEDLISILGKFYKNKISIDELMEMIQVGKLSKEKLKDIVEDCRYVHYGFTFNDCFILDREKEFYNGQMPFIKNTNELLFVFYKYRIDQRKIPCPACGGLHISGNSFPEIGHRSWECKSPICPERSKSNRGKRYSKKSNYMQWGALNEDPYNVISKELIKKWRRDIVKLKHEDELYEMIVKYFTFPKEKILFINCDEDAFIIAKNNNRSSTVISRKFTKIENPYISDVNLPVRIPEKYNQFFRQGRYVKRYLNNNEVDCNIEIKTKLSDLLSKKDNKVKLIHGDCFNVLSNIDDNVITSAVTSPPYYNAREYSQWPNLYLYLEDMYNIIKQVYRTMKPGGVFLFNIGDIVDNENTIVKSNMGNKRILLGSYTIHLFQEVGFELIENIIWDKGEPQSNRQKNDGKFTPHYQKPLNCYEHMFIFKKPGADLILNKNYKNYLGDWNKNIVKFPPVIKINSKKENKFGHTAPFPRDIPDFVSKVFMQNENDIMLDPFSGSLTSSIVAASNNVIGLGIELSEEYVELSINRALDENYTIEVFKYDQLNIEEYKPTLTLV